MKMTREQLNKLKEQTIQDNAAGNLKDAAEAKQGEYALVTNESGKIVVKKKEQGVGLTPRNPQPSLHQKAVNDVKYKINRNTRSNF